MAAKEKAKELVDKFWYVEPEESCDGMEYQMAQQCALIAVDEILYAIKGMVCEDSGYSADEYYLEVKQEIKNL